MIVAATGWLARFNPDDVHLPVVVWSQDENGDVNGLILDADGVLVDAWERVGFAGYVFDAAEWQRIANLGEPFAPPRKVGGAL